MKECLNIKCPICKGKGTLNKNKRLSFNDMEFRKRTAKILRKNGFTLIEITKILRYKSQRSVQKLLTPKDK